VVVRDHDVIVIVPAKSAMHSEVWALPKGHLDGDETPLEAATREVREETGVQAVPVDELGEIQYTFERGGREVRKRVVFYLFEYAGGELAHDHEIADVRWMPLDEAVHALTHVGEREMAQRALSRLRADR
jgi:8-oxo-dGTP pyrophosphatase MutT (NUDIX family)